MSVDLAATFLLVPFLLLIVRVDLRSLRIPDALSLPLIPLGLVLAGWSAQGWPWNQILGAVAGWGSFALLGAVYFRLREVDGLGRGDAKLLGAAGAWVGASALPLVVLIAALGALGFALLRRHDPSAPLAFGPWLCVAFFVTWCLALADLLPV